MFVWFVIYCGWCCQSRIDIFIQVNNYTMKPLEEYMLFTKTGAENITVINSQGVRSCQCSLEFDVTEKNVPEPSLNFTVVRVYTQYLLYITPFNRNGSPQSCVFRLIIHGLPQQQCELCDLLPYFKSTTKRTDWHVFVLASP